MKFSYWLLMNCHWWRNLFWTHISYYFLGELTLLLLLLLLNSLIFLGILQWLDRGERNSFHTCHAQKLLHIYIYIYIYTHNIRICTYIYIHININNIHTHSGGWSYHHELGFVYPFWGLPYDIMGLAALAGDSRLLCLSPITWSHHSEVGLMT
jgi:hypothetical protein